MALKHRRIAFVSGPLALKSARIRRVAFLKQMKKCGLRENQEFLLEANHSADGCEAAMNQLLRLPEPPTAVLCSNDLTAIGALRAIHKYGLRVPEDISLVGFDDIQLSEFTHPALSTIRLFRDELGRKAFEALHRRMETKRRVRTIIQTRLVVRESTSPAKEANTTKKRGTSGKRRVRRALRTRNRKLTKDVIKSTTASATENRRDSAALRKRWMTLSAPPAWVNHGIHRTMGINEVVVPLPRIT